MAEPIELTFLGTGNFYAPGRYWNGFIIDGRILVETPPSLLANAHRLHLDLTRLETIFLSHFHADHTFGWPFLLNTFLTYERRTTPLSLVGPPGVEGFLDEMVRAGRLDHVIKGIRAAIGGFVLEFTEVDEADQEAGNAGFRAYRVEHDPALDCYGYLIRCGERTIGYSGDTEPCNGLRQIAAACDLLVLECNQPRRAARAPGQPGHMSLDDVRELRLEFPDVPFILTHVGRDVDTGGIPGVTLPDDLQTITV